MTQDEFDFESGQNFGRGGGRGRGRGLGRGRRWIGSHSLMDVRLIEPALLAFLKDGPLHGYGLLEKLDRLALSEVNPSVIYRILRDYEEIGYATSDWDSESTQGPPRRVYSITEEGRAALKRARASLVETSERINELIKLLDE